MPHRFGLYGRFMRRNTGVPYFALRGLTPEHGVLAEPAVIHFIPEYFGQDHARLRLWLECPLCAGRVRYLYAVPAALVELAPQLLRHRAFACNRCHDLREASHRRVTHERRWKRHVAKQRRYAAVLANLNSLDTAMK